MNSEIENNEIINNDVFDSYVGVSFTNASRTYYFGVTNLSLKEGDKVVVETARGLELGAIVSPQKPIKDLGKNLGLKPILRVAGSGDIASYESNLKAAKYALDVCKMEAAALNLEMNLISAEYTLDKQKVCFTYLADNRVDFRELLKVLGYKLHSRIDLRQISPRDKAKAVGGIGSCGLKLCCSTFLNEFEGIGVNKAKNQMLAINIPKISGHCGKLLCCLNYEDDAYTEAKKEMPDLGTKCFIDKVQYTVSGINVISKTVRLSNEEDIINLPLEEFKKQVVVVKQNKNFQDNKPNEKK